MSKEKSTRRINRREFIKHTALVSGSMALLPSVLSSCADDDDSATQYTGDFGFREGVASFDPTASSVILWTRYTSADNETGDVAIQWEVAESNSFSSLTKSGTATAAAAADYTVSVDVTGLTSNKKYFYRFRNDRTKAESLVGETRTLPTTGQASSVKLAVVSCANYQAGLFNVYGAVAESAADVVVHLGDYIYEYGAGGYGTNPATAMLNRAHLPAGEILTIEDYRTRYKQYRSDKQLQKAHQLKPFICVWDDHEIANDAYKTGAENHTEGTEGAFEQRKQYAIQVWHEYLPARVSDKTKIYRSFDFGGLVNLMMLDTRLIGRDKQLSLADYINPSTGAFNTTAFGAAWLNPNRTILGAEQKAWLTGRLGGSTARWQVLGSQVLMGKMYIPVELLFLVAQLANNPTTALLTQYSTVAAQLAGIKVRIAAGDSTVTAAERARVTTVLPYNLDAWDGYPAEREAVFAAAGNKKLVSLAGDTHNAWYSDLKENGGRKLGAEFACSSVSSPGFETILAGNAAAIKGFEQSNELLIDDLHYLDASQRGFVEVTFTAASAVSEWKYVASLTTESTATTTGRTVTEV
ncbi:alkaline phosphatase D family protein [Hymenobacter tibetensis]|uniref:Alkaline phosphatase D family protein n=1 Tax=Hymenobacter tibetensis TaxID=497967 RepID=A0ABY4CZY3_9BACT|nr:alkaline phosphatase D family protein [Hymenobacter tibetensis]UOG73238.1 alkaline phosphatase D family protein [Hymenobacter tibetensis]